ncbi:MAG: ribosome biogenesis GTPase Der [Spirochaetota bacterium]
MKGLTSLVIRKSLPQIVIVGRPNVGKSTLFNRLLGKRRAITDIRPGVTRDPVEAECDSSLPCLLIDTGGFKAGKDPIDRLVVEKSIARIKEADLILLVMDVHEITSEDEAFVEFLRPYSDKIFLVVNKADNPKDEYAVWNFQTFGFPNMLGISAAHGIHIGELKEKIAALLAGKTASLLKEEVKPDIRLAVLGKPNTGKSTLVNKLTKSELSIVSEIPGTTRDVIEGEFVYNNLLFRVCDTAGIRKKKKVDKDVEYYSVNRAVKSINEADVVFLIIDAAEELSEQDKKIASLVVKKGKGIILVLNKWDIMQNIPNQFEAVKDRIRFVFPVLEFAPVIPISALYGRGIDTLMETGIKIWRQLNRRIDTSTLNQKLKGWIEHYAPPLSKKHTAYKLKFITQIRLNPVHFIFFVNRKKGFPGAYIQYIKNRIRKEFGFSLIPFNIELKEN